MLNAKSFYDLSTLPKWLIDNVTEADGSLGVFGWALPEDRSRVTFTLDGKPHDYLEWGADPLISQIYPYLPQAEFPRFHARFDDAGINVEHRFSLVRTLSGEPFSRWCDIYYPPASAFIVEPEPERMRRTQGNESLQLYKLYGYTTATKLDRILRTYLGKSIADFKSICDWGCGCGRIAQHVLAAAPNSSFTGIDIDKDNVEWCKRNLAGEYADIALLPPTQFKSGSFDLLYGISVFSHLTHEAFVAWVEEIARLVKPGGGVLVTVNGTAGLIRQAGTDEDLVTRVLRSGFDDGHGDGALAGKIGSENYYRATYILEHKVHQLFSKYFIVRDILRQSNGASQDMVVLERRD